MPEMQQICLALTQDPASLVKPKEADSEVRLKERDHNQQSLLSSCPQNLWPKDLILQSCPHPILVSERHLSQLRELHEAFAMAINNIVQRWWTDKEADFPRRMPLESHEEDLLQVCLRSCLTLIFPTSKVFPVHRENSFWLADLLFPVAERAGRQYRSPL